MIGVATYSRYVALSTVLRALRAVVCFMLHLPVYSRYVALSTVLRALCANVRCMLHLQVNKQKLVTCDLEERKANVLQQCTGTAAIDRLSRLGNVCNFGNVGPPLLTVILTVTLTDCIITIPVRVVQYSRVRGILSVVLVQPPFSSSTARVYYAVVLGVDSVTEMGVKDVGNRGHVMSVPLMARKYYCTSNVAGSLQPSPVLLLTIK